jgi:hypothetical protein
LKNNGSVGYEVPRKGARKKRKRVQIAEVSNRKGQHLRVQIAKES